MNETSFWRLVEKAQGETGITNSAGLLMKQLQRHTSEEIASFFHHYTEFRDSLHSETVWQAANLVTGRLCDALLFHFFRIWVVSLGQTTFNAVLANPDSLAEINKLFPCGEPEIAFDTYNQVPRLAYFSKEKVFLYGAIRQQSPGFIERPIALGLWSPAPQDQLVAQLPRLWRRQGEGEAPPNSQYCVDEEYVPNVGILKRGTELIHDRHGPGLVVTVNNYAGSVMAQILFEDGIHPMYFDDARKWSRP